VGLIKNLAAIGLAAMLGAANPAMASLQSNTSGPPTGNSASSPHYGSRIPLSGDTQFHRGPLPQRHLIAKNAAPPSGTREALAVAPGSSGTQLCFDNGNSIGLSSTCAPAIPPPKHCEIFSGDQSPACRLDAPEPGTLLLLGIGLLGLTVMRRRRTTSA